MPIRFAERPPRLVVFDFDQTMANTFASSPNVKGVAEACEAVIFTVFGAGGIQHFNMVGGLKNRSPRELVEALVDACGVDELVHQAQDYLKRTYEELASCVPRSKGCPLICEKGREIDFITELCVRVKIRTLLPQIGQEWPMPYEGFFTFCDFLGERGIPTSILSAGHELFIRKFFAIHNRKAPFMLTDDDVRGSALRTAYKPDPRLYEELLASGGFEIAAQHTLSIGDDLERDGELARQAGARFGWFNPDGRDSETPLWNGAFEFRRYRELQAMFPGG